MRGQRFATSLLGTGTRPLLLAAPPHLLSTGKALGLTDVGKQGSRNSLAVSGSRQRRATERGGRTRPLEGLRGGKGLGGENDASACREVK